MIATAPGKLILTGEYAVLEGASALVIAVNRRVIARRRGGARGSAPFLVAVAEAIARRLGAEHPAARAALEIECDSRAFFLGAQKLGLGSSAAVTVASTALALAAEHEVPLVDRELVAAIAFEAHAEAQRGVRTSEAFAVPHVGGSGADIAAAAHGGVIAYRHHDLDRTPVPGREESPIVHLAWPSGITLIPFFTGASADTRELVAKFYAARDAHSAEVEAALRAIADTSRAACQACAMRTPEIASGALISALALAARATDQLAAATHLPLVPACVTAARAALTPFGGTAKTTGAGGGDVAIAVIPATEDRNEARRLLIESGCQPLDLAVDSSGVDLSPDPR